MSKEEESPEEFSIGQEVKVSTLGRVGEIVEGPNKRLEYAVQLGGLNYWVHASLLKTLNPVRKKQTRGSRRSHQPKKRQQTIKVDLHGMTRVQAAELLELTLDKALLQDADCIEVVHGIGSGVLLKLTEEYFSACKHVATSKRMEGNPGTTLIYLRA